MFDATFGLGYQNQIIITFSIFLYFFYYDSRLLGLSFGYTQYVSMHRNQLQLEYP